MDIKSADVLRAVVVVISIISGVLALAVIVGVVILAFIGREVPEILGNWGGIILGFYFGQFFNLMQLFLKKNDE
jgi:uncharacterized RDD family membrane protein YckC